MATVSGNVNGKYSLQALVDGKKIIVTEAPVRRDLQLNDEEGTNCLPNATIFKELTRMGTMASAIICLATNQKFNFSKYIFESMVKNLENVSGEGSTNPTDPHHTPIIIQPSTSQPQKKQKPMKPKRKDTEVPQPSSPIDNVVDEAVYEEMDDVLEREDASKQRRKIDDIDKDAEFTLVDETQRMYGDDLMFDTSDLASEEVFVVEQGVPGSKKDDVVSTAGIATTTKVVKRNYLQRASGIYNNNITFLPTTIAGSRFMDKGLKVKGSETRVEGSSKRAREELEQESSKKQKLEDDKEIVKLKRLMEVMRDKEEVALDVIPLAIKSLSIVDWKIHKEGKKSYYQIIRADGHLKSKYGSTRPAEDLDLVLYGDLKTMFEPHVEDNIWKNQSDYKVLDWKLYDSCGVHSLRKQNVHIHMLVDKRYPFTTPTITNMLNRKLKDDHWNEMCYQLLNLLTKQLKNQ
ncbi:hypothetical protein Tco_0455410 [Tanacetum coccineum]